MTNLLDNMSAIGILLLGSGGGIRFLVSAGKIFAQDVLPLMRQSKQSDRDVNLVSPDSIVEVIRQFRDSKEVLIRIEEKLESALVKQGEHSKYFDEVFSRLRLTEIDIASIKSRDTINITNKSHSKG